MLSSLDKINLTKVDPSGIVKHIHNYSGQIQDALMIADKFTIPSFYIKVKKVVILGMGGSGISAEITKSLLEDCPINIEVVHDYSVPVYTDQETLVIVCSYSGDTEESIAGFFAAKDKNAKIMIITTGGQLKMLAGKFKIPYLSYEYQSVPRAAYLYSLMFLLTIFSKLGYYKFDNQTFMDVFDTIEKSEIKFSPENNAIGNPAKLLADKIFGKIPVIYASSKLIAVAKRFKGQFNENAKNFAFFEEYPEFNHNAIEGLSYPKNNCVIISLESNFEVERVNRRQNVVAEILMKNHLVYERVHFVSMKTRLSETIAMLLFCDYVSYYLAILNKVDPTPMPNIDFLKSRLG